MRRSTVIYILILLVAIGAYYFIHKREKPEETTTATLEPSEAPASLFSTADGAPTGIRIEAKTGEVVEVTKTGAGTWELTQPYAASADPASAEAAASEIAALQIEDTIPGLDLAIAGLKEPEYTITVAFGGVKRNVEIGVVTPTGGGYYALAPNGDVIILNKFSVDDLLGLLTNPPYLETPTPSPTATETPLPSPTPEPATPTQATPTP